MASPFIGEIRMAGFNFAPRGWALCNGQLLSIAQNTALFSLLGTTYGGNGTTTFGLPNLQASTVVGQGQGPGLSDYVMGEVVGESSVTLLTSEIPAHTHGVTATAGPGIVSSTAPTNDTWQSQVPTTNPPYAASANTAMGGSAMGATGGDQPHANTQPFLVLNFIIAVQGVFPARN